MAQSLPDDLRSSRLETVFYLTFLITVVHAGFILWDMVTLLPGAAQWLGLSGPNTVRASAYMSTLYLTFLGAYASYKEFLRWTGDKAGAATPGTAPGQAAVPDEQALRFKRGEVIVAFWSLFAVVAIALLQLQLIARLPQELFRTTLQVIGVLFGTYASRGLPRRSKRQRAEDLNSVAAHEKTIVEYVAANGSIDNEACQKLTGLGRYQAYRLLKQLNSTGILKSEGSNKGRRYIRPA